MWDELEVLWFIFLFWITIILIIIIATKAVYIFHSDVKFSNYVEWKIRYFEDAMFVRRKVKVKGKVARVLN
jgi:hypothetical protein